VGELHYTRFITRQLSKKELSNAERNSCVVYNTSQAGFFYMQM